MTAVIRLAEASCAAWIMMSSSMNSALMSPDGDCTMKRSEPRTFSSYRA
jgi:hypothetical protein